MLLVTYKSDRGSLDRAKTLSEAFAKSNSANLIDTWGWVQFKRGEIPGALTSLQAAAGKAPTNNAIRFHLAMAQLKSGSREEARSNLERALKSGENFSGVAEARTTLAFLRK
jgi:Flp pilus assembly protein TadD